MVEAAGVEPASEILVSKETPCVVAFRMVSLRCAQNGQDAHATSPIDLISAGPDIAGRTSLLCDVLPQPAGKIAEDGYLFN